MRKENRTFSSGRRSLIQGMLWTGVGLTFGSELIPLKKRYEMLADLPTLDQLVMEHSRWIEQQTTLVAFGKALPEVIASEPYMPNRAFSIFNGEKSYTKYRRIDLSDNLPPGGVVLAAVENSMAVGQSPDNIPGFATLLKPGENYFLEVQGSLRGIARFPKEIQETIPGDIAFHVEKILFAELTQKHELI